MSNTITIELCTEDRARVDRLTEALERIALSTHRGFDLCDKQKEGEEETDDLQKKLAETLAKVNKPIEAPKNAPEEAEASTLTAPPLEEEKPTAEEPAQPATEKTVNQKDIRALYVKLSASGKKKEAQAIILPYATAITAIPDDKCPEVYEKLIALEG